MSLSICIPTYNRGKSLVDCLNSLHLQTDKEFEVCISDNFSDENIQNLIQPFRNKLKIKFSKNNKNLGAAMNFLKVASMAQNEFIWFLGDDDLLIPSAIQDLKKIIKENKDCDFFWVNSSHLDSQFLEDFSKPFDTKFLPKNMKTLSNLKKDEKLNFFDLISNRIAFDYLLGVYVCVFKKDKWKNNLDIIDYEQIKDQRAWSNFDNTCFHIKIFCEGFNKSKAYFCSKPLSVNLHGIREWKNLYPLIEIVRIPEALDYYRSKGLNFFQYIREKNHALRNFFNYFAKIFIGGKDMGKNYINFRKHFLKNLIYPNSRLSIIYFILRKIKSTINS